LVPPAALPKVNPKKRGHQYFDGAGELARPADAAKTVRRKKHELSLKKKLRLTGNLAIEENASATVSREKDIDP